MIGDIISNSNITVNGKLTSKFNVVSINNHTNEFSPTVCKSCSCSTFLTHATSFSGQSRYIQHIETTFSDFFKTQGPTLQSPPLSPAPIYNMSQTRKMPQLPYLPKVQRCFFSPRNRIAEGELRLNRIFLPPPSQILYVVSHLYILSISLHSISRLLKRKVIGLLVRSFRVLDQGMLGSVGFWIPIARTSIHIKL